MIFCWDQLLRSSVQIICWDYLLRSAVTIICWDRLLKLSVVIICCVQKTSKNPWAYHQKQEKIKKPMSIAANANKVCKSIKKPMSLPAKTRKDQKTHEHSSKNEEGVQTHQKTHEHSSKNTKRSKNPWALHKTNKLYRHIKKPMSIAAKTKPNQKTHEHSIQKSQKVLNPTSIAAKTQKQKPRLEQDFSPFRGPALTNTALSHAHTASPRPLARTHDTNTKRNRNRFPDWGSHASINSLNLRYVFYSILY